MANMTTPADIAQAEAELIRLDPVLAPIIQAQAPLNRLRDGSYFARLAGSIVSQQISVAAAASILARLESATELDPVKVTALNIEALRALGLSRAKATYIRDLAEHFVRDGAVFDHLDQLPDGEVIAELIRIKGIGVWTAQMFLMFRLGRLNVFAPDDIGLQRAIFRLYNFNTPPTRAELERFSERWRPYRTVASWHLWESLDNTLVSSTK